MMYVVAYDVEDDAVRSRVAAVVEQFGRRVQKSVFECELTGATLEELRDRLARVLTTPDNGHIRVYRSCADCWRAAVAIGNPPADEREGPVIVA